MIKRETLIEHFSICSTIIDQNAETIDNNLVITCYSPNQNNINFAHQSLTIDQIIKNELNNLETLKTIETEQYLYFFEKIETNFCFIFVSFLLTIKVVKNYYSKFNNFSDIIKNCLTTQFTLKIFVFDSNLNSATAFNVCYFSNSKINIYLIWKGECNPNIDEFFKYSENIYYLIEGNIIYKQPTNQVIINHPVKWIFIIYKNSTTYRMITNSRVIKCSHSIELDVQKLIYQLLSNAKKKRQSSIKEFIRINEKSWLVFFFFLDHSCFILIENDTSKILNIIECAENVMKKLVRLEYVDIPLLILAR
ncbi:hypothetical protein HZS_3499 [Henneguya salminicola]|nr:hypothetical protein HZS_3499 [Henneguya salminicola]